MKIGRILLPTDLSKAADRALSQAVELAVQHRARIEILHVVTLEAIDPADLAQAMDDFMAKVEGEVFDDLATRTDAIRTRGLEVETAIVRSPYPVEGILERIRKTKPDVVVMGTHGRSGIRKLLLGSVAASVVLEAPCPVMTVAMDAEVAEGKEGFDPILVPIDFSRSSEAALEAARGLVAPSGKLVLEHVVSVPAHPPLYAGGVTKAFQLHPELPRLIGEKLAELYPGPAEIVVTEGDIVEEILRTVKSTGARLLVMGTRGLHHTESRFLGSITHRVIGRAKIPVLAVK